MTTEETNQPVKLTEDEWRVLDVIALAQHPLKFYEVADLAFPKLDNGTSGMRALECLRSLRRKGFLQRNHKLESGLSEAGAALFAQAA